MGFLIPFAGFRTLSREDASEFGLVPERRWTVFELAWFGHGVVLWAKAGNWP